MQAQKAKLRDKDEQPRSELPQLTHKGEEKLQSKERLSHPVQNFSSSSSSDHADRDGINWGSKMAREDVRDMKDFHDTVVHQVVLEKDANRLKDLLKKGLMPQSKSIDGATPLHRAAEVGSIPCAEVLLEFNADINATNLSGQTPFHVAALNHQIEFGLFLMDKKARINCTGSGAVVKCTKCRWLTLMISRQRNKILAD